MGTGLEHAFHGSLLTSGNKYLPSGFQTQKMEAEHRECISRQAVEIFTAMVNSGHTFEAALSAIYLTGLKDAIGLMKHD